MSRRVAEHLVRVRPFGPQRRLRVDLHGVSAFGPGEGERTLIRWEWIREVAVDNGVVVRSAESEIRLPPGSFGLAPEDLAERLRAAGSITERPTIIGQLSPGP